MIGGGRVVQRQQSGLGDENVCSAILEQLKGLVRLLHRFRISTQPDPAQVAAQGIDLGLEYVGDDPHPLAAAQGLGSRAYRRRGGRHVLTGLQRRQGG